MSKRSLYVNISRMPIIKSAKKKLRKDRKRELVNQQTKFKLKALIKNVRRDVADTKKVKEELNSLFSALDKATKTHLIHANRASRLKSRLSKLVSPAK